MKASDNLFPKITLNEAATDGSDFSNPSADYRVLFLGEDGELHLKDSSGTVTDVAGAGGDVATDTIWAAQGDIAVATGNDAAAVLTKGATGTVLTAGASTLAYAFPPGHEYSYVQFTADVNITATSEATADTVVTAAATAFDGSTVVLIEFFSERVQPKAGDNNLLIYLFDDTGGGAATLGRWAFVTGPDATNQMRTPVFLRYRLTPSAATHTYSVRASVNSATGAVGAGATGAGNGLPGYIRITKV